MTTAPTLTDGVVTLRPPAGPADIQGSYEQSQDPLSIEWTTVPVPYSHGDAVEFMGFVTAAWEDDREWGFVVEYEGEYGGHIALRPERTGRAEIAYGSHPRVRGVVVDGRSVMERALRLLIEWGFSSQGLQSISWWANLGNWSSRKLAWKLGFTIAQGTVRGYLPHRGEMRDAWVGTLLRDDVREPSSTWLDVPFLTDGRAILRPFRDDDLPRIVDGSADPATQYWLDFLPRDPGPAYGPAYLEKARQEYATATGLRWALSESEDGPLLGTVGLFRLVEGRQAEIGYWTHPDARGRGLTTAGAALALRHGFETLQLERITGNATATNTASRRILEALGMRFVGLARHAAHTGDGELLDLAEYDMTAEEFAAGTSAPMPIPTLTGTGVTLRRLRHDDVPGVREAGSDERTQYWLGNTTSPYTVDVARQWVDNASRPSRDGIDWAITDPTSGTYLGTIGLFDVAPGIEGELTFIGHPAARGRGVMTEAARLVIGYAFDELGLRIVRGTAAVENKASRHVMEAAGMTFSGVRRFGTTMRAGRADAASYEITRDEHVDASRQPE